MWGIGVPGIACGVIAALVITSGLFAVMYWLAVSVVHLVAPEPPTSISAGISISCVNSVSGLYSTSGSTFTLRLPSLVTWLPWRRTVLHLDGSRRVSQQLPEPPKRNPTCRIGQCNLRYDLDLRPCLLPAIIDKLLTNSGKFAQTAEARKWLFTVTTSLKTVGVLWRNIGINRGNFTSTVGILPVNSENYSLRTAVLPVDVRLSRKLVKYDHFPSTVLNPGCQRGSPETRKAIGTFRTIIGKLI